MCGVGFKPGALRERENLLTVTNNSTANRTAVNTASYSNSHKLFKKRVDDSSNNVRGPILFLTWYQILRHPLTFIMHFIHSFRVFG